MRLDKFLADAGIGTRSEVKKIISKGRVTVNDACIRDGGVRVDGAADRICIDGEPVAASGLEYYMLNKPAGIVSAARVNSLKRGETVPEGEERYAVDLIRTSVRTDLFPAGRLDKDTEGFLLITNDGALAHRLLSPRFHVEKTYSALLSDRIGDAELDELEQGVDIGDDTPTLPCKTAREEGNGIRITITEGRYHQIKRMFARYGLEVLKLKRLTFGPLRLDERLAPGEYRELTEDEILALKNV